MKTQNKNKKSKIIVRTIVAIFFLVLVYMGGQIFFSSENSVYVDSAYIQAPIITLGPIQPGILNSVYVKPGDYVQKGQIVALVNNNPIKAQISGLIITTDNTPGQVVTSSSGVVTMIDPNELRLIGKIKENQGLEFIKPGENVTFTIDAYPGKTFYGKVESVAPSAIQPSLSFSISSSRQEREFQIKVNYNLTQYQYLKNGMSAKMWISKK